VIKRYLSPVWLIAKREIRDQFRDWRILFPLVVLTLIFPLIMNMVAHEAVAFVTKYSGTLILDRLVPFSVLIIGFFPITVSLVVALESFVGEKERGTIEPLLSTPLLDWQLYLGKLLVGVLTPLLASFLAVTLYLLILARQEINLPDAFLIVQLLALNTAHTVLMVSGAIAISAQSTSVRAANLLASFIVIPVAFLIQGESAMMFWGNKKILWLAVLAVSILTALLIRVGLAHFRREYLLGREIDVLNLRWMWRTFARSFQGRAGSLLEWYRIELPAVLHKMRFPIALIVILALIAGWIGSAWTSLRFPEVVAGMSPQELGQFTADLKKSPDLIELGSHLSVPLILGHNLQAVGAILIVGLFSFSVLGVLAYFANMGIVGAVLALFKILGYSPWMLFFTGVLPHGIFEIPAVMLSSAAVLRIGAVLVTPDATKTMGEVLLETLADWFKIVIGFVVPLLVIAAVIETYITPLLLLRVFR
jgi:uncharacterized membrane protein SpoIIM required for sporulation/ABC-type transport system involved in multi-copper enzyme maturation permease subunit